MDLFWKETGFDKSSFPRRISSPVDLIDIRGLPGERHEYLSENLKNFRTPTQSFPKIYHNPQKFTPTDDFLNG